MPKTFSLAVGLVLAAFSSTAVSQQSSLSGLLQSVQNLRRAITPPAQSSAVSGTSDPQADNSVVDVLKTYAALSIYQEYICRSVERPDFSRSADADFKLGSYAKASAGFRLLVATVAVCAVGEPSSSAAPRIPLPQAIDTAGAYLAASVIAARAAGMTTSQSITDAENAVTLLSVNKAKNEGLIQKVIGTGLIPEKTTAVNAPSSGAVSMTATEAVAAYKGNGFGFNARNEGKVLSITGKVQKVSGSGQLAIVTLQGHTSSDLDNQGYQDVVRCVVNDSAALGIVANLQRGQMTTVTGLYRPTTQAIKIGIELQSCRTG